MPRWKFEDTLLKNDSRLHFFTDSFADRGKEAENLRGLWQLRKDLALALAI
jgi:hypothetical protein